jgi:outer membrane protein assembly factor BamA
MNKNLPLLLCSCLFSVSVFAQDSTGSQPFVQQDIKDWLRHIGWSKKPPKPASNNFMLILPYIASNPTAGLMIGGGLTYAFKANKQDQRLSSISANASYSTKKLLNLNVKSNAFVMREKMVLNGDWRLMINSETTFGLGTKAFHPSSTQINGYDTGEDTAGQVLRFNQVRLHEVASYQLVKNVYAGIGFHFDYFYNIQDAALSAGDSAGSHHYQYSITNGFDYTKYTISGFSVNLLLDSRDNQVNAYKGYYANVNFRMNSTVFGSSQNSTLLLTEYRSFHSLDPKSRHILAFWLYGNWSMGGEVPYLLLPAVGYDQRQRSGRGFTFGRFRGINMAYGETEYRFPISKRTGILGGVAFVNATTTDDPNDRVKMFQYLRAAWGGGLRIMMDKTSRTRLEVDAAIVNGSMAFYLGAQETF